MGRGLRQAVVILLVGGVLACGGDGGGDSSANGGAASEADSGAPAGGAAGSSETAGGTTEPAGDRVPDPAQAGGLSGQVVWSGAAPERPFQKMVGDHWCLGQHEGGGFAYDAWVLGEGGGLANVFVQVVDGLDGWQIPEPGAPVVLDQVGCLYTPKMVGVQRKQTLTVRNSDKTMHNVHVKGKRNKELNRGMPEGSPPMDLDFKRAEIIEVVCDVHAWMRSWIGVVDHPYFAVSDADGRWSIEGLPPGDYTLELWHEKAGKQTLNATVAAGSTSATATVSFSD